MADTVLEIENLSKLYRLGSIGTGSLRQDLQYWWNKSVLRREDPFFQQQQEEAEKANQLIWALRDVSFELRQGEALGIIGSNGSGKITTIRALLGLYEPTAGTLLIDGEVFTPKTGAKKLGYLPGDMYAKVNPYLRPLYDGLFDMMEMERANRLIERGDIEIAPLAFMRGRTLNDSFVILDEAQNATAEQMKMFLTRLGFHSKAVVTGDITQIDLPSDRVSGLIEVRDILQDISGIEFVYFDERDVVRHRLVQEIIKAYDRHTADPINLGQSKKAQVKGRRSNPVSARPLSSSTDSWGQPH